MGGNRCDPLGQDFKPFTDDVEAILVNEGFDDISVSEESDSDSDDVRSYIS